MLAAATRACRVATELTARSRIKPTPPPTAGPNTLLPPEVVVSGQLLHMIGHDARTDSPITASSHCPLYLVGQTTGSPWPSQRAAVVVVFVVVMEVVVVVVAVVVTTGAGVGRGLQA